MAEVNIVVNGRSYRISCDDGQEPRVLELGKQISSRVDELRQAGAGSNDAHLMVLSSLIMADELEDLRSQVEALGKGGAAKVAAANGIPEERMIKILDHLSGRLEGVTQKIQSL